MRNGIGLLFIMIFTLALKAEDFYSTKYAAVSESFSNSSDVLISEQSKEKLVMVHFWATWCPPCIKELPDLLELAQTMQEELAVVIIAVESPRKSQKYFLNQIFDEYGRPSSNVVFIKESNRTIDRQFDVQRLPVPASYLFDREGYFLLRVLGRQYWSGTRGNFVPNWWPWGETWKDFLLECWFESEDCIKDPHLRNTSFKNYPFKLAGFSLQF